MIESDRPRGHLHPPPAKHEVAAYVTDLFAAHFERLQRRVRRAVPGASATDIEELAAEVLARRFVALSEGRPPLFLPPNDEWRWLQGIAQRVAWEFARSQGQLPHVDGAPLDELPSPRSQPDEQTDVVQATADRAVAALPEAQRRVMILHLEGLTIGEIGDVVACDSAQVSRLLYRARERLRASLIDRATDPDGPPPDERRPSP